MVKPQQLTKDAVDLGNGKIWPVFRKFFIPTSLLSATTFLPITFAFMRGLIFLIPSFIIVPNVFGVDGIWLALAFSEIMTTVCIFSTYVIQKRNVDVSRRKGLLRIFKK